MRQLRFLLEAAAFRTLLALAAIVPRSWLLAVGAALGSSAYRLDRRHREIGIANLLAAGVARSEHDARAISLACWRHFGRILLDTLAFERFSAASVGPIVEYEGLEHLRRAYATGRGAICFSAHFGHWELSGLMQGHLGMKLALVARPLDNPRLEEILRRLRGSSGNQVVHRRNALKVMLAALRRGDGVAILIDQDARDAGVFVPFFGRPASTTPVLALLALRTGAPLIPSFSIPLPGGRYRIVYEAPIAVAATGDRDADVQRITAECTAVLERWISAYPELWLWMHRRWKTTSPLESKGAAA
jgi:KDO2-lipid IV(A) lauroyltransferase